MKIVGIIQARNGSSRLNEKSLLPLAGSSLIQRYIERVKRVNNLTDIILGTTQNYDDEILCEIADSMGIKSYMGSQNDLIRRIYTCAMITEADLIVRLCADNPLLEPMEVDRIIQHAVNEMEDSIDNKYYLYSNTHNIENNGYPDGLGAEVYHINFFREMHEIVIDDEIREHPHLYAYNRDAVKTIDCPDEIKGYSHLKLDVNTQDEYDFISGIYDRFGHNNFKFSDYKDSI
jgi:spore coat polysaccharide biosynthesis protein SpsF